MHYRMAQYGFEWGSAKVERLCSDDKKGWVLMGLETPKYAKTQLQIYVTRTGKVRIFSGHGMEWKPAKRKKRA